MPWARASCGDEKRTETPSKRISPDSRGSTPVMVLISVDFPAPLSPMRATTSPGKTSKSTFLRACTGPKCLLTRRVDRTDVCQIHSWSRSHAFAGNCDGVHPRHYGLMSLARSAAITKGCGCKHAMPTPTPLRVRAQSAHNSFPLDMKILSLAGKSIVLGVSGGIAAYKSAIVASQLVQAGAKVDVLMTEAATRFIQPLTFNAITHRPVHTDVFAPISEQSPGHVEIALEADLIIVAPATAHTIAALALGISDDLISLVTLSSSAPVLIAPAMEEHMYNHPATQANIATLFSRGVTLVGPDYGRLASGQFGIGRLAAPEDIVGAAQNLLTRRNTLMGRKLVVTAGGTREALDPVRFLGNRSSGRMGFALAEAAVYLGADVVLIAGPSELRPTFWDQICAS